MNRLEAHQDIFTDLSTLNNIRKKGREDNVEGIKEVAKKFESMFVHMMLKSMRDANKHFQSDLSNSFEAGHHRDMYDQQLAVSLTSSRGIGIADAMAKQLISQYGLDDTTVRPAPVMASIAKRKDQDSMATIDLVGIVNRLPQNVAAQSRLKHEAAPIPDIAKIDLQALIDQAKFNVQKQQQRGATSNTELTRTMDSAEVNSVDRKTGLNTPIKTPEDFVTQMYPQAIKAGKALGVDPKILVAQAALETGWGQHVSQHRDGGSSFNLFNIKADQRWQGDHVTIQTLEYRQGQPLRERANFRSYDSFEHSFNDYVDFIQRSPRYQQALRSGSDANDYIRELQQAGYATDPQYAEKVLRIYKGDYMKTIEAVGHSPTPVEQQAAANIHVRKEGV